MGMGKRIGQSRDPDSGLHTRQSTKGGEAHQNLFFTTRGYVDQALYLLYPTDDSDSIDRRRSNIGIWIIDRLYKWMTGSGIPDRRECIDHQLPNVGICSGHFGNEARGRT